MSPVVMSKFLFPFAVLLDGFFGPLLEVPRLLGKWVVCICVDDGISKAFLEPSFEEFDGGHVVEWSPCISCNSFEVGDIGVKVVFLFYFLELSQGISGFVGVGECLAEVCFKEVPQLFVCFWGSGSYLIV